MPSAKYAFSLSLLKFSNGRTAMDFSGIVAATGTGSGKATAAVTDLERTNWNSINPVATTASTTVTPTIFRPVLFVTDLFVGTSDSNLIPSGVISKAQDKASTIGNPRTKKIINTFITQGGASKAGRKIDAA